MRKWAFWLGVAVISSSFPGTAYYTFAEGMNQLLSGATRNLAKQQELNDLCSRNPGDKRCKKIQQEAAYCASHPMDAENCDAPSAARLMQDCDTNNSMDHAYCFGTLDAMLDNGAAPQLGQPVYPATQVAPVAAISCVPKKILNNPEQVRLLFVRAAHEHPEVLHFPARRLLFYALAKAFPCYNPLKDQPR